MNKSENFLHILWEPLSKNVRKFWANDEIIFGKGVKFGTNDEKVLCKVWEYLSKNVRKVWKISKTMIKWDNLVKVTKTLNEKFGKISEILCISEETFVQFRRVISGTFGNIFESKFKKLSKYSSQIWNKFVEIWRNYKEFLRSLE